MFCVAKISYRFSLAGNTCCRDDYRLTKGKILNFSRERKRGTERIGSRNDIGNALDRRSSRERKNAVGNLNNTAWKNKRINDESKEGGWREWQRRQTESNLYARTKSRRKGKEPV